MAKFTFRKWNAHPTAVITSNFRLKTKLQNFESFYSKKSIAGYIVNLTDSASTDFYSFNVSYRGAENGSWIGLGTITKGTSGFGPTHHKRIFSHPIANLTNFQLQLNGRTKGKIAINDITILYRSYRDISEDNL